ncbi:amino acid ABC transporter permease [Streptomyces sp. LBUM 1478]|uniref:amino acid ABC transporter permease n=1 Tax=Streptomyces scabiei TaxID=1930 RepID=UPI0007658176|nr:MULTISPECIES: amino acid ABC transporter permease [Streptomyces]MBP5908907.1 amino acid ABC transporter permease [Streptomyces sp. LBUM 1478]MBP5927496.1 amino acid ABC transporter permease [Streptomyces sp. LBUM 1479]MBP5879613.1 amino acid ABC transporter permease [Streptomyces sp. LBUM 1477]MBP5887447.1 amino acid ABC transporter permease [Streptomyces sp. LBUM 1487]MDW8477079.1 amino acid ABC transporter permease [Streptomyces scabiei]
MIDTSLLAGQAPVSGFDWPFFWHYLLSPSGIFLEGLWRTVYISVVAQTLGVLFGLVIALAQRSRFAGLRWCGRTYVWLIRGTPLLVQLVLVYNGLAAAGVYRFTDVQVGGLVLLGVVQAAVLTLAVNEAAYMAEIIRAALDAIDRGQTEAAQALGMTPSLTMRVVLLPQALRIVVPPLGNEFNLMMKSTSLLSVIGLQEMFLTAQSINSATFKTFEIFLVAACYYLALTTVWSFVQRFIERRLADPGTVPPPGPSLRERFVGGGRGGGSGPVRRRSETADKEATLTGKEAY